MYRYTTTLIIVLVLLFTTRAQAADVTRMKGSLDAVTVYRGQALVTRLVEVPDKPGLHEIVVTNLPDQVVPDSLYAESADGVEVRSVLYREQPVQQDVRGEVREIDQEFLANQNNLETTNRQLALVNERLALVEKLEQFTAPTVNVELTKGILNPNTLKEMTVFLIEQRQEIAHNELTLRFKQRELQQTIETLRRQRQRLAGSSARTAREALVFVNVIQPKGEFRLRYLVNRATWSPSYTIRAESEQDYIQLEYLASIQQKSGEDWNDVTMTLSTATPSLVAEAPVLTQMSLSLQPIHEIGKRILGPSEFQHEWQRIQEQRKGLNQSRNAPQCTSEQQHVPGMNYHFGDTEIDVKLNDLSIQQQLLELAAAGRYGQSPNDVIGSDTESISVTYQLPMRSSLPSRSDRQLIQIASVSLEGEFYKLACPVLTEFVYEEAVVTNTSDTVFLAGPVASYLNGEFVGHGDLPTVAVSESFTVGLGIDSTLRAIRLLENKKESIQGGNRVVDATYILTIDNFGTEPAIVRLLDRLPISKGSEITVSLLEIDPSISDDLEYLKSDRRQGILRWDLEVPPQTTGTNATTVKYDLRLEYDKQMTISGLAFNSP